MRNPIRTGIPSMHACLVTETYTPEINGVALTVHSLLEGLLAQGHRVTLVRPVQAGESPGCVQHTAQLGEVCVPGAALPRYPGLRFGYPVTRRLRTLWRAERPDVLYIATEGPLGWAANRVARRMAISTTSGFHTRFDDFVGHYGMRWLSPLVFAYLRHFHNTCRATLVPTQQLAAFLRERGFRSVRLLKRAVDTSQFDPARRDPALRAEWGVDDDALAVIYVGRIAPEKNLDVCVAAFRAIQSQQPNARLVWVGDGPSRQALQQANPDFVFCGVQRGAALGEHYASADMFLFPSITETFGNVTLEGLASGLGVVSFDYGAAAEHIDNDINGCTVPFADNQAFIAAAQALSADRARLQRLRRQARLSVVELSPESVSRSFSELLLDCSQAEPA